MKSFSYFSKSYFSKYSEISIKIQMQNTNHKNAQKYLKNY